MIEDIHKLIKLYLENSLYKFEGKLDCDRLNMLCKSLDIYSKYNNKSKYNDIDEKISFTMKMLENDISYLKIFSIDQNLVQEFLSQYIKTKYLILDLRDNLGGVFEEALELANILSNKTKIFVVDKNQTKTIYLNKEKIYKKIICIVNENTLSSAELIAGVLKESQEDIVISECNTFGKNTIQKLFDFYEGYVSITVAKFIFKDIGDIEFTGIEPDYKINRYTEDIQQNYFGKMRTGRHISYNEFGHNVFSLQQRLDFLGCNNVSINGICDRNTMNAAKDIARSNNTTRLQNNVIIPEVLKKIDHLFMKKINSHVYDNQLNESIKLFNYQNKVNI